MINAVHYFVRHPVGKHGLVYPSEIDTENYVGFGNFYLLGQHGAPLQNAYQFFAVYGEQLIDAKLLPYKNSKNFFIASIEGIGDFVFFAETILNSLPYLGDNQHSKDLVAVRRLRSWQPNKLESVCKEKAFYFVGYSPLTHE